jgi:hypothetical protein
MTSIRAKNSRAEYERPSLSGRERYSAACWASTYRIRQNRTLSDTLGRILRGNPEFGIRLPRPMAEGFLADHAAAARQLPPMDPRTIHPVVHSGPADSGSLARSVNWQELGFFPAMVAKEDGHDSSPTAPVELAGRLDRSSCLISSNDWLLGASYEVNY